MAQAKAPSYRWNIDWLQALVAAAVIGVCIIALVVSSPPSNVAAKSLPAVKNTGPSSGAQRRTVVTTTTTTTTTTIPVASGSPSKIVVEVLNGNGTEHAAEKAASALSAHGFQIKSTGDADSANYRRNLIQYAPDSLVSAQAVERYVAGTSVLQADSTLQTNEVVVTVGATNE